jgi:hypothetical protein
MTVHRWATPGIALALAFALSCSETEKKGSEAADPGPAVSDNGTTDIGSVDDPGPSVDLPGTADAPTSPDVSIPEPITNAGVRAAILEESTAELNDGRTFLKVDLEKGRFDMRTKDGEVISRGAVAAARWKSGGAEQVRSTASVGGCRAAPFRVDDALGEGAGLEVACPGEGDKPDLLVRWAMRGAQSFATAEVEARWPTAPQDPLRLVRLSPFLMDAQDEGALFVGDDPPKHMWLDNGYDLYLDYDAQVRPLSRARSVIYGPGASSNWNVAVVEPGAERSLVAGFLSNKHGAGMFTATAGGAKEKDGSRTTFGRFEAFTHYLEGRAPAAEGEERALTSELLLLDLAPKTPFDGLEDFADAFAKNAGKVLRRDIPSGWNSWGGGAGSGGYGTDIDEKLILDNLDAAVEDFLPFGMTHYLIDDGWQQHDGDWFARPDRFPDHDGKDGVAWMAEHIRSKGFIPGIWISPFNADKDSSLVKEHPDWFADLNSIGAGMVGDDKLVLDLSHPDVLDWLEQTFSRITRDWGYRWIKLDFGYYALFTENLHNKDVTPTEAYVEALRRVREAMHPDTFFLAVAAVGLSMHVADGNRITLDNEPWWGDQTSIGEPGFKVTYHCVAHRYYLSHRLWVNHPDLLFFREDYGLTLAEARVWASVVALTGGIVKLGESYLDMHDHPEWRAVVEQLLPVHPATARPLDMFERHFPELWHLPIERGAQAWQVVGLFNWGMNRDISASLMEEEQERTFEHSLSRFGLDPGARVLAFDAWEHTWRWIEDGLLKETLAPRTERVLLLRPEPATPAVIATSRHLLGGAVEVSEETWSEADGALEAKLLSVPGRSLTAWVATAGRTLKSAHLDGKPATVEEEDGVAALTAEPSAASSRLRVVFE